MYLSLRRFGRNQNITRLEVNYLFVIYLYIFVIFVGDIESFYI